MSRVSGVPPLLLDLYELTMAQSYWSEGLTAPATFSLFARHLPTGWGFFLAAGLEDVLTYLEELRFGREERAYLESTGLFTAEFLAFLETVRFTGDVRALPEGTVCFPQEPLVEVTAPLIEAQIAESTVLNHIHFQTLVATKAARCVHAAKGRPLVDFSLRRTHGVDASLHVARSAYLAGFASTSNVEAGRRYGIPIAGTMAHSYIQVFEDELDSFRAFARLYPGGTILLVDTYDTLDGTRRAAMVGNELAKAGHRLRGIRLDSGNLVALSFEARRILDAAGLERATIIASGGVDEHLIAHAVTVNAPIDSFGIGSRLGTVADSPYLDMAYKLVSFDDRPVLKLSPGKATWPGPKQVWRQVASDRGLADRVGTADEPGPSGFWPLLEQAMHAGRRLRVEPLDRIRARATESLAALPEDLKDLRAPVGVPTIFTDRLVALRDETARHARATQSQADVSARERA